ncbi:MAG TPA: hypothetical protein VF596_08040 [Pyrinomonadaceae bacterium]|jgi:hypothetical protein
MGKYKELYDYSKGVFDREYDRFKSIDGKAAQYISVLTLLIGIVGFFVNWAAGNFLPPKNYWEVILFLLTIVILITITVAWFQTFRVIKMQNLEMYPLNSKFIDFFNHENEDYIYYKISIATTDAFTYNRAVGNRKSKLLNSAYKWICASVVLLIFFTISFGIYTWNSKLTRSNHMPQEKKQQNQESQAPDQNKPEEPTSKIPSPSSDKEFPGFDKVENGGKPFDTRDTDQSTVTI